MARNSKSVRDLSRRIVQSQLELGMKRDAKKIVRKLVLTPTRRGQRKQLDRLLRVLMS